jgi:hypothetical protein
MNVLDHDTLQFSKSEAKRFGMRTALVLSVIRSEININIKSKVHYVYGHTWALGTTRVLRAIYLPFLSETVIQKALTALEAKKVIISGHPYMNDPFIKKGTRAKWYRMVGK